MPIYLLVAFVAVITVYAIGVYLISKYPKIGEIFDEDILILICTASLVMSIILPFVIFRNGLLIALLVGVILSAIMGFIVKKMNEYAITQGGVRRILRKAGILQNEKVALTKIQVQSDAQLLHEENESIQDTQSNEVQPDATELHENLENNEAVALESTEDLGMVNKENSTTKEEKLAENEVSDLKVVEDDVELEVDLATVEDDTEVDAEKLEEDVGENSETPEKEAVEEDTELEEDADLETDEEDTEANAKRVEAEVEDVEEDVETTEKETMEEETELEEVDADLEAVESDTEADAGLETDEEDTEVDAEPVEAEEEDVEDVEEDVETSEKEAMEEEPELEEVDADLEAVENDPEADADLETDKEDTEVDAERVEAEEKDVEEDVDTPEKEAAEEETQLEEVSEQKVDEAADIWHTFLSEEENTQDKSNQHLAIDSENSLPEELEQSELTQEDLPEKELVAPGENEKLETESISQEDIEDIYEPNDFEISAETMSSNQLLMSHEEFSIHEEVTDSKMLDEPTDEPFVEGAVDGMRANNPLNKVKIAEDVSEDSVLDTQSAERDLLLEVESLRQQSRFEEAAALCNEQLEKEGELGETIRTVVEMCKIYREMGKEDLARYILEGYIDEYRDIIDREILAEIEKEFRS